MKRESNLPEKKDFKTDYPMSWDRVKDYIYPLLCSYERNRDALQELVYHPFLDLAVCYYIRLPENPEIITITEGMSREWEISKEDLQMQAMKNLKADGYEKLLATKIITDMIDGGRNTEKDMDLAMLTNHLNLYGSAGILYSHLLRDYADMIDYNLFLLGTSIHEFMILPDNGSFTAKELRQIMEELNRECVSKKDFLADRVYYFDRAQNEVSIAA